MTALDRLLVKAEMRCDRCDGEGDPPCGACALDHRLARIVRVLAEHARYFADSPPEEHGGYSAETIAEAKRVLAEAEKIAGEET